MFLFPVSYFCFQKIWKLKNDGAFDNCFCFWTCRSFQIFVLKTKIYFLLIFRPPTGDYLRLPFSPPATTSTRSPSTHWRLPFCLCGNHLCYPPPATTFNDPPSTAKHLLPPPPFGHPFRLPGTVPPHAHSFSMFCCLSWHFVNVCELTMLFLFFFQK